MNMNKSRFENALRQFDDYNSGDNKVTNVNGRNVPDNVLYGIRLSEKLIEFAPTASEALRLAARSQHIGRWEIPRSNYPMDRNGYLKWRSQLKLHHANVAGSILKDAGYEEEIIKRVKDLLMKRNLKQDPEAQILEDIICLVFLQYYFDDFSTKHDEDKLVQILKKTLVKMSAGGIVAALKLPLSERAKSILEKASSI